MKKIATEILWDVDHEGDGNNLPYEMEIPKGMDDIDEIGEYLSNSTGFCHDGFVLNYIITEEEILAMIKSKSITYQWVGMDKDEHNADEEDTTYFVALCQANCFVEKTFPVYILRKRVYTDMEAEIANKISSMFQKGRIHIDEEEISANSFESRRKVIFTDGMSNDQMLIITDAPKKDIETWCRRYLWFLENGGRCELFDTLKTKYYVKELLDSEIDDEESFEVLGYDESYDFSNYTVQSNEPKEFTKEDLRDEVSYVLSEYDYNNPPHQRGTGEEMLYEILSKVKKNWEFLTQ